MFALSFSKWDPEYGHAFRWTAQLHPAVANPRFWHGLRVTAWFAIGGVAIQLVVGFIVALALQEVGPELCSAVTTLFLIPSTMTVVVAAMLGS